MGIESGVRRGVAAVLNGMVGLCFLAACTGNGTQPAPVTPAAAAQAEARPTAAWTETAPLSIPTLTLSRATLLPSPSITAAQPSAVSTSSPVPTPTLAPNAWMQMPVVPTVSAAARAIYKRGLALGNNPRAFSKVGDCETAAGWFLVDFDKSPRFYNLGAYTDLQGVIDYFAGSYQRTSLAAKPGFTASSVLTPLWADRKLCKADETPLACELRIQRPSIVIITLGSNNAPRPATFEPQLRRILDISIQQGVLPILATKADNLEKDNSINAAIARLAYEYDIPLWNFWRAVQELPNAGLQDDAAHLTWAPNHFEDPANMQRAWPVRNLTALQVLDTVWKGLEP